MSEEIGTLKADAAEKASNVGYKKEMEKYKQLLAEKVKENVNLSNKLDTVQSMANLEKNKSDDKNEKDDGVMITIKCKQCRFVAKTLQELRGHKKFVHLTCKFCNKLCDTMNQMDQHIQENHPRDYRPACDDCKMMFPNKNTLEGHIKKKHNKKYACQV